MNLLNFFFIHLINALTFTVQCWCIIILFGRSYVAYFGYLCCIPICIFNASDIFTQWVFVLFLLLFFLKVYLCWLVVHPWPRANIQTVFPMGPGSQTIIFERNKSPKWLWFSWGRSLSWEGSADDYWDWKVHISAFLCGKVNQLKVTAWSELRAPAHPTHSGTQTSFCTCVLCAVSIEPSVRCPSSIHGVLSFLRMTRWVPRNSMPFSILWLMHSTGLWVTRCQISVPCFAILP